MVKPPSGAHQEDKTIRLNDLVGRLTKQIFKE